MYCPKCGNKISDDCRFCKFCGRQIMFSENSADKSEPMQGQSDQTADSDAEFSKSTDRRSESENGKGKKKGLLILLAAAVIAAVILSVIFVPPAVRKLSEKKTEEAWEEQYNLGEQYLLAEDYEQAVITFTEAIEIDPEKPDAYMGRAKAYFGSGDSNAAIKDCETVIDLDQTCIEAYIYEADIYISEEEYDKAKDVLDDGLENNPDSDELSDKWNYVTDITAEKDLCKYTVSMDETDGCTETQVFTYTANGYEMEVSYIYYDEVDNTSSVQTCEYTYDENGNPYILKYYYNSESPYVTLFDNDYDADGNLISLTITEEYHIYQYTFSYDEENRLTDISGCYDPDSFDISAELTFTYDASGRISAVKEQEAESTAAFTCSYDADGNLIGYTAVHTDTGEVESPFMLDGINYVFYGLYHHGYMDDLIDETFPDCVLQILEYGYGEELEVSYTYEDGNLISAVCVFDDVETFRVDYEYENRYLVKKAATYCESDDATVYPWITDKTETYEYGSLPEAEQEESADYEQDLLVYKDVLDELFKGIAVQWNGWDMDTYENDLINSMWYWNLSMPGETQWWEYPVADLDNSALLLCDLDGDGISELAAGGINDNGDFMIMNLYTVADGEIVSIAAGGPREWYSVCEDGTICYYSSSPAIEDYPIGTYVYYELENGSLNMIESVSYDLVDSVQTNWEYTSSDGETSDLTSEEAQEILDSHAELDGELIMLSEYDPQP